MSKEMPRAMQVDDKEILKAFDKVDGPVCTVPDLDEYIALGQDGIRHRLKKLEEKGEVKSRKVGARAVVWWRVEN